MNSKAIVITGALGFIGSGVVRHLNEKGITNLILVDDIGRSDRWKNLTQKSFHDLISKNDLFSYLEKKGREVGAIIHLGACSDTLETDGDFLMENNTRFSIKLVEHALFYNHRFIYASSAATYGDGSLGFKDEEASLGSLKPLNLYGFSKHLFDLWLKERGLLDRVVGLKYFNIYGPNENHKGHMASMIFKMFSKVREEQGIQLFASSDPLAFEDGEQKRDFLYVKDAVKMTCAFLENELTGIYNVGSGTAVSWNRLARALFSALKAPIKIEYIPMPSVLAKQYQNYTCASMEKWKGLDLILPSYTVEEAVHDYVNHYLLKDAVW